MMAARVLWMYPCGRRAREHRVRAQVERRAERSDQYEGWANQHTIWANSNDELMDAIMLEWGQRNSWIIRPRTDELMCIN